MTPEEREEKILASMQEEDRLIYEALRIAAERGASPLLQRYYNYLVMASAKRLATCQPQEVEALRRELFLFTSLGTIHSDLARLLFSGYEQALQVTESAKSKRRAKGV